VRVIRATSAEGAYRRAGTLGTEGEHSYRNADGDAISWQFLGVAELDELLSDDLVDGATERLRRSQDSWTASSASVREPRMR